MKAVSGSIKKQPAPAAPRSAAATVILVRTPLVHFRFRTALSIFVLLEIRLFAIAMAWGSQNRLGNVTTTLVARKLRTLYFAFPPFPTLFILHFVALLGNVTE